MKYAILCDCCEKPLSLEKVDGTFGCQTYQTKEWNTKSLYSVLCKRCATSIDAALRKMKNEIKLEPLIVEQTAKWNAERKERLGTKG